MPEPQLDRLLRFTRTIAAEEAGREAALAARGRPMGPLRALMAIGAAGMDVGALRDHLTLDSGLMSRQLRQLEEDGLITVTPDPEDARRRRATCTPAGLAEIAACQQLTRDRAAELHDLLDGDETLLAAMDRVATLLAAHRMRLRLIDPDSAEAAACLRAYYTELSGRFGLPFTPGTDPDPGALRPPRGAFLLSEHGEDRLGCVSLRGDGLGRAEIKCLWVSPDHRGVGLGRRLMAAAETEARRLGLTRLRLDTSRHLPEALTLYRRAGWQEIPRYNDNPFAHHWFEKQL